MFIVFGSNRVRSLFGWVGRSALQAGYGGVWDAIPQPPFFFSPSCLSCLAISTIEAAAMEFASDLCMLRAKEEFDKTERIEMQFVFRLHPANTC